MRVVLPTVPVAEHDLHELVGAVVAVVVADVLAAWPMFSASASFTEVTTFQAARPPVIRSSVANTRATWNGS